MALRPAEGEQAGPGAGGEEQRSVWGIPAGAAAEILAVVEIPAAVEIPEVAVVV